MSSARMSRAASPVLVVAAACMGLFLAGCDDHVQIIRDHNIKIAKHATWAWRPSEAPRAERDGGRNDRPVISRDVIGRRGEAAAPVEKDPAVDIERREVQAELERQLIAKGMTQVTDPAAADFLVDYHFAVRRRNATVPYAYGGYYPGLVCGPFGCYGGWGGPAYVGYERIHFREGTFVFDMVKQSGHQLAYRAIGEEPVHRAQFSQDQIHDMVHALLKDLKTVG